jgi:hypothetical protein
MASGVFAEKQNSRAKTGVLKTSSALPTVVARRKI